MPFILCDYWDVYENIIAGPEVEVEGPFDDQMNDLRWQQDSRWHVGLSAVRSHPNESQHAFDEENAAGYDEPLPEVGAVKQHQKPERNVQQMSPVKDFEASAAPYERKWTDEHDQENCNE